MRIHTGAFGTCAAAAFLLILFDLRILSFEGLVAWDLFILILGVWQLVKLATPDTTGRVDECGATRAIEQDGVRRESRCLNRVGHLGRHGPWSRAHG